MDALDGEQALEREVVMKTIRCMGSDCYVQDWKGKDSGFAGWRFPFYARAQVFDGYCEWRIEWSSHGGTIDDGRATSLEACASAIDAARIKALRDLAEQLKEVE